MSALQPGLARRAAFALVGQLCFYGLGVGLVLALLAIPWAQARYQHGPNLLGMLAVPLAGLVGWAMLPPLRRPEIHGLRLSREQHAALFALLDRVSANVGVPLPEEVWLVPDANAFIGRVSALGRRRRLGIGLGLLQILDHDELSSVIGHELGHARGGDVALGPWILGTRNAIHVALDRLRSEAAILHLPFLWYGRWYLRASLSVSRAQELAADAVAASVAGQDAAGRALKRIHEQGPLWDAYWRNEVIPLLERRRLPPLGEGFKGFLSAEGVSVAAARLAEQEWTAETSVEDSHPALAERLRELGLVAPAGTPGPVAASLLSAEDHDRLARSLLVGEVTLTPVAWMDVGEAVRVPVLRAELEPYRERLAPLGAVALGAVISDPAPWLKLLRPPGPMLLSEEAQRRRLISILGAHLVLLFARGGWRIMDLPGEPLAAVRGEERVLPFKEVARLADEPAARGEWKARAAAWGIG